MALNDVPAKIETMFPQADQIPPEVDFAPGGGTYTEGDLYLIDGEVRQWTGRTNEVLSPVCVARNGAVERRVIGQSAALDRDEAFKALDAAVCAYDRGQGKWPTMTVAGRIDCMLHFCELMKGIREQTVRLLMWEIGKTRADSEKEFDRTLQYIYDTIESLKEADRTAGRFTINSKILAQVRRSPLGVVLCMGPFNYPINETFATLIPALIMGNTVVAKLPRFGALSQAGLLKCFAASFPRGVVNVINGAGREVIGPLMESGKVAALAFIGTSRAANALKKQHPKPNRLRSILALEAKNPAIIFPDADLAVAVNECVMGTLSFNGQRCTALKILFVQRQVADQFLQKLADRVDSLPFGMPWEPGVMLTPLPEHDKVERLTQYVEEAVSKGGRVVNRYGGQSNRTFFFPAIVYPVAEGTALYTEEQFGPVIGVAPFDKADEIVDYIVDSDYGQQASVFGQDPKVIGPLVDVLVNQVSRVNLNAQCQRGPDVYPFTGRKDSAEGTLSVSDALRSFSIRSMVAAPESAANQQVLRDILTDRTSHFINTDYIF